MSASSVATFEDERLVLTGVRRLTPDSTTIFEGTFSLLHCGVKNDDVYRGVYAVLMFPIRYPEHYISLRFTDINDKDKEIGIIEHLRDFPKEAQDLVRASLVKHYYEQVITRIHKIDYKFGLLFLRVEMTGGREIEFMMRWSYNYAEEFGDSGKVLIDVYENRYLIPDVTALPSSDRREFTSFIYW